MGFKQMVNKPTRDSGTIIDHVFVTNSLKIVTDVTDCYYSISLFKYTFIGYVFVTEIS